LTDRPIALLHLILGRILHELAKVHLNVLQSNGRDQSKVLAWILATVAIGIIWEFAKAGIASSVAKKIGMGEV
jgi:hypothetical protein